MQRTNKGVASNSKEPKKSSGNLKVSTKTNHKKKPRQSANASKKSSSNASKKGMDRGSKTATNTTTSQKRRANADGNEVFFVLGIAFAIFIILSLHTKLAGGFGLFFRNLFTGLFAGVALFIPYLMVLIIFAKYAPRFKAYKKRIYLSCISMLIFMLIVQGMVNLSELNGEFWKLDYLKLVYFRGTQLMGNGVLGVILVSLLYKPIGIAGLLIVLFVFLCIMLISVFYVKPTELVEKMGVKAINKTKQTLESAKQSREIHKRQRQAAGENSYMTDIMVDELNARAALNRRFEAADLEFESILAQSKVGGIFESEFKAEMASDEDEILIRKYDDQSNFSNMSKSVNSKRDAYSSDIDMEHLEALDICNEEIIADELYRSSKSEYKPSLLTPLGVVQEKPVINVMEQVIEIQTNDESVCDVQELKEASSLQSDYVDKIVDNEARSMDYVNSWGFMRHIELSNEAYGIAETLENSEANIDEIKISMLSEDQLDIFEPNIAQDSSPRIAPSTSTGTSNVPMPKDNIHIPKAPIGIAEDKPKTDCFGQLEASGKSIEVNSVISEEASDEHDDNASKLKFMYENYKLPGISLLEDGKKSKSEDDEAEIMLNVNKLRQTFKNFKIDAKITEVSKGPMITRFEIQPSAGVKVSKIVGLSDDIALNLAATSVRIVAPIPGKSAIGIEIPNKSTSVVSIKDVVSTPKYEAQSGLLKFGLGLDISGEPIVADLSKMPHLLIAGATGSGKSVCVNTIISSILLNAKPDEVKFLMIDPKVVELNVYNGIAHLILPVVTDPKKASIALNWAVSEMTDRYSKFAQSGVKDINGYNRKFELGEGSEYMPRIVVIIDELSDLMMAAPNQVEEAICRLAQMARACGIHLIVATQRPSVDVITGVIKANIPSRIAFAVSSQIDSRTIIDGSGAEKLLGKGDMLYYPAGMPKPLRVQGSFISEEEVEHLVEFISSQSEGIELYNEGVLDHVSTPDDVNALSEVDELLQPSIEFVIETQKASTSLIQRKFRIGYNRAARIMEALEEREIVGPSRGSKPREVLVKCMEE